MTDRKLINRVCVALAVVLVACALVPAVETFVGVVAVIGVAVPLAGFVVREGFGELLYFLEARRKPSEAEIEAWRARQPRPRPPLTVDGVVVDAPTAELEVPR